ncbi:hypothetical protein [Alloactinosynnema sp. L-07]|nr:hypothetical protein [Alloactinosynnema sp. L-07]
MRHRDSDKSWLSNRAGSRQPHSDHLQPDTRGDQSGYLYVGIPVFHDGPP